MALPVNPARRALIVAAPAGLAACVGLPSVDGTGGAADARAAFDRCLRAHGLDAWRRITDVSVAYDGEWYSIVKRVQPVLVDEQFRRGSEERLLTGQPVMSQLHTGPGGRKFVRRDGLSTTIWYNNSATNNATADAERIAASSLVVDAYRMFLCGPFFFVERSAVMANGGSDQLDGRRHTVVLTSLTPGLGWAGEDRFALYIDETTGLLSRVRFTIEALDSTKGAVVEVDFSGHREMAGVQWPTRFFERIRKPLPMLPAHRWWMTGLDVNRGLTGADLAGPAWSAKAGVPARRLEG